jgi:hypothetical protein
MFSIRLWKGLLRRMYQKPDIPKFDTRFSPGLSSAIAEAGEIYGKCESDTSGSRPSELFLNLFSMEEPLK